MAYQEILVTDTLNAGRIKINDNFSELYNLSTVSVTGGIALDATALNKIHLCSGTTADYTVDLPTAVGNSGIITFKGLHGLTKVVTVAGISGQTIAGEANRKIASTGILSVMSDGANWVVVGEVGSWIPYTPTWTGWSAAPTVGRAEYFRVGKMITVRVDTTANGTSNATTKFISLPLAAKGPAQLGMTSQHSNNGTTATSPGLLLTVVDTASVEARTNMSGSLWTASGGCRVSFTLNYVML
jgi:hypothetical protein